MKPKYIFGSIIRKLERVGDQQKILQKKLYFMLYESVLKHQ